MIRELLLYLALSLGINLLMFLFAYRYKTDRLTDISYALTFMAIAVYGLFSRHIDMPRLILAALVVIWAVRIGGFLLVRIWRTKVDHRFDDMRDNFFRFAKFWLLQGVTVWVVLLACNLAVLSGTVRLTNIAKLHFEPDLDYQKLAIESVADLQKYRFSRQPANKNRWIESGLWRYSRHPNYFGEILVWLGVYLYVFSSLSNTGRLAGLVSPIFITVLLLFVSGIPLLEKSADARWGGDTAYRSYRDKTSVLVPLPKRGPRKG